MSGGLTARRLTTVRRIGPRDATSGAAIWEPDVRALLEFYFWEGLDYAGIESAFKHNDNILISLSAVKRRLRCMGLQKRVEPEPQVLRALVQAELKGPGQHLGYRLMRELLRSKHKVFASQRSVSWLQHQLHPEGVAARSRWRPKRRQYVNSGPGDAVHLDGNDKLVPFGFAIHGGIDGWSNRILWLRLAPSNKNPRVVSLDFLNLVERHGCPRVVRCDPGTENAGICRAQLFLRMHHSDSKAGPASFWRGKSTQNQRIEKWWSVLRGRHTQWWMTMFRELMQELQVDLSNNVERSLLAFVFAPFLEAELQAFVRMWNSHRQRTDRLVRTPRGRPNELFFNPVRFGSDSKLLPADPARLAFCRAKLVKDAKPFFTSDFAQAIQPAVEQALEAAGSQAITMDNAHTVFATLLASYRSSGA